MRTILKNFHLVDEETDISGTVIIEDGRIIEVVPETLSRVLPEVFPGNSSFLKGNGALMVIDGKHLTSSGELPLLMPAFVDLHAHFRDPGPYEKNTSLPAEVLESASLSAVAGGFGTVVCMANTKPPIDTVEKAAALKNRSGALGLIDLYPVLSLSKNMEGKELSDITLLTHDDGSYVPPMLSEDGKDLPDDGLFLAAMKEAKRLDIPISCHCDFGGDEDSAVRRVIELGKKADCRIHIAHVSTMEAIQRLEDEKRGAKKAAETGFKLTCEVTPHHLCLIDEDAEELGEKTWGRVNPPLGRDVDRASLLNAFDFGAINAIATDHAPHSAADKEAGAPGFSGFETAFAAVYTDLALFDDHLNLSELSALMSAGPANILGLDRGPEARGRLFRGYRADLVIIDTTVEWIVDADNFKTRGKNSPFLGNKLYGKILMTLHGGRVVFNA